MELVNVKEYEILRKEVEVLRNCVTTYIGFVLAGSGAAAVALANAAASTSRWHMLGYAALAIALTVTMVELVLLYKFNSHNRYVGYCKLLTHERFNAGDRTVSLLFWEICMDLLVAGQSLTDLCHGMSPIRVEQIGNWGSHTEKLEPSTIERQLAGFMAPRWPRGKWWTLKGIGVLVKFVLSGRSTHDTWRYPVYVTALFSLVCSLFTGVGLVLILAGQAPDRDMLMFGAGLAVLVPMWLRFFRKLYALMEGDTTVDAYCWKFLPLRYHLLKNEVSDYRLMGVRELKNGHEFAATPLSSGRAA